MIMFKRFLTGLKAPRTDRQNKAHQSTARERSINEYGALWEQLQTGVYTLGPAAIRSLVRDGTAAGSEAERPEGAYMALYLLLKSYTENSEEQLEKLQGLITIIEKNKERPTEIRSLVRAYVESLIPTDKKWSVDGQNVWPMFSPSLEALERQYMQLAQTMSNDTRDVFLVGNATFVGLTQFIYSFAQTPNHKPLYIVMPARIKSARVPLSEGGNQSVGYKILHGEIHDITVDDLVHMHHVVLIDNMRNTGATEKVLQSLFQDVHPTCVVDFEPLQRSNA
jgi:hypothetical protein